MSQTPITVTYDIKELFANLEKRMDDRFDRLEKRMDDRFEKLEDKVNNLEKGIVEIKGEIKALDKRIDNQEILNRITLGGVIVVILGGAAKMFGWWPNP